MAATAEEMQDKSVRVFPKERDIGVGNNILWFAGAVANSMIQWGSNPSQRDRQLRAFYKTEAVLFSSVGIVTSRNAAMEWKIDGPDRVVSAVHDMLSNANYGKGMQDFLTKLSVDLYTQDKGAFVEIIKNDPNDEASGTIGIANLDAAQCMLTGNPKFPVIYTDQEGKFHKLPSWRVYHVTEMATTEELLFSQQFCAVSRVLAYAEKHRDLVTYESEKISGRFQRVVHVINGPQQGEIQAALDGAQTAATNAGQSRYIQPAILATMRPDATLGHVKIELASLPDAWDKAEDFKEYISIIAMAFLSDYLEFAPLPGGNIGSASQADQMDKKSRAKGAENFRKIISQMMNHSGILPRSIEFSWLDNDYEEEATRATLAKTRAEARTIMVANGELDRIASLKLALDAGDIPQDVYDYMVKVAEKEAREAKKADAEAKAAADAAAIETEQVAEQDEQPGANPDATDGKIASGQATAAQDAVVKTKSYAPKVSAA